MNIHSLRVRGTMASYYSVDDVLAYMEIPLPDEDDISEDEFEGYIDQKEEEEDDEGEGSGDESDEELDEDELDDACENDNIPKFMGQGGCTQDMSNKSPIDFLQLFITDEMLHTIVQQTN